MSYQTRKPTGKPSWPIGLLAGGEKAGKAQPLDARIATPAGWTTMGELTVGSLVIGGDGTATTVSAVHERGVRPVYRIRFSDGSETRACAEHLWQTWTPKERNTGRAGTIRSTSDLAALLAARIHPFIPITAPVEYEPMGDLPIHPYLLGVLIGDGSLTRNGGPGITCGDADVIDRALSHLSAGDTHARYRAIECLIHVGKTSAALAELGLDGIRSPDRFIPAVYRRASVADRLLLLQGLMDTDGGMERRVSTWSSASPVLAEQFQELVESLGGTASHRVKLAGYRTPDGERRRCRDAHILTVRLPNGVSPFQCERKLALWEASRSTFKTNVRRSIRAITPDGVAQTRCIEVAAADHLYLTDRHIVTHNTYACAEASASDLIGRTFWVTVGEDQPDEYGAIPGARFEIVEHDGTYRSILGALEWAAAHPPVDGKPNLIVLDSGGRCWTLLSDNAQNTANERAKRKNKSVGDDGAQITMDLWNTAKQRWGHILDVLRSHQGPSLITARLEQVSVVDDKGDPTREKTWKVQAEKNLPFEVGFVVHMRSYGDVYLTGVRSLRFKPKPNEYTKLDGFTVDQLWRNLGLDKPAEIGERQHAPAATQGEETERQGLLNAVLHAAQLAGADLAKVAQDWADSHDGQHIGEATDLGGLELLRDELLVAAKQKGTAA